MAQDLGGVTQYVSQLAFAKTNVADANGTLNTLEGTTLEYVMPYPGSIIGFSASQNATLTTGTLTFQPTINGSLCPVLPSAANVTLSAQRSSYTQDAEKANYTFTAGQRVGVHYNASDTINATTTDLACLLVVLLDSVRY